jgi:hypothetical protein
MSQGNICYPITTTLDKYVESEQPSARLITRIWKTVLATLFFASIINFQCPIARATWNE